MAKELTTQKSKSNVPATSPDRNWAEEYGDEAFTSTIVGDLLKFNKGEWLVGQEEEEMPMGTELIAAAHLLQSGWMRWSDEKPVEIIMGLRSEGYKPPERETLGYLDKEEWGELNGQKIDPWRRTDVLLMADPDSGQVYTYSPMSDGGLQAIKRMMREYGPHMRTDPNDIPIVKLGSEWYKHPKFGKVYKPILEVVGWRDADDVSFEAQDNEEEEAREDAKKTRATKTKPAAPAKTKTKTAAPPPAPRRASNGARGRI